MTLRDRGPARYGFVGRQELRDEFKEFLDKVLEDRSGSTFLIQGPPGVGKTALLHQLAAEAREGGWKWARISAGKLHSAPELAEAVGESATTGRTVTGGGGAGVRITAGVIGGDVSGSGSRQTEYAGTSIEAILQELGKRKEGTLLILDEAQTLAHLAEEPSTKQAAGAVLRQIHEGQCGGPVVLLAGGLGHSQTEFARLGISRFRGGAVVNLGRLSSETARELIEDYLAEGNRKRQPMKGQRALVQEILDRSHGWPQHLVAYGDAIVDVLDQKTAGRALTEQDRQSILASGDQVREAYYRGRIGEWGLRGTALLGALVQNPRHMQRWDRTTLDNLVNAHALDADPIPDLVDRAIAKGVLAELPRAELYHIPIPSMAQYLVDQLKLYQQEMPERAAELKAAVEAVLPALARQTDLEAGIKTIGKTRRPGMMRGGLGAGSSRDDLKR